MNKIICFSLSFFAALSAFCQQWTLKECIDYAWIHNHQIKQQMLSLQDEYSDYVRSFGAFLPAINGNIAGQYNFGRAVDPETNGYTNVNTFYNTYTLQASLSIFEGLSRFHNLRAAKARVLMGKHGLQAVKDEMAQKVMRCFMDVLYYQGTVRVTTDKRQSSAMLLRQTYVMNEVGTKSEADVAQMKATLAADEYEVTLQEKLLRRALMELKELMNYPMEESLEVDTAFIHEQRVCGKVLYNNETFQSIAEAACLLNPSLQQTAFEAQALKYALRSARGSLLPSISVGAGISSSYFKTMGKETAMNFNKQLNANRGEYVFATLAIPIFNRLERISSIRKQKNQLQRIEDVQQQKTVELKRLVMETLDDYHSSLKESMKLKTKVTSDFLSLRLTVRKYEEGLASGIEVQTAAVALLQSQTALLQSNLNARYSKYMLNYYKGIPIWIE